MEEEDTIECCISLDARPVYRRNKWEPQTVIGFKRGQSSKDCFKQCTELKVTVITAGIYTGTDNRWYLKRNIKRLQDWVFKVYVEQHGKIEINGKWKPVNFIVAGDLSSLQSLFGPLECFRCTIPAGVKK